MSNTNLLLLQPVENLGHEGDEVTVKAGFARNYLLPRGIAIPVTRANRKQIEVLRKRKEQRLRKEREVAETLAQRLGTISVAFPVKTGPGGKVFGAITSSDLLARLQEEGIPLDKRQVALAHPVNTLGRHSTRIRLHSEISVDFEFEVVSENPIEETEEQAAANA